MTRTALIVLSILTVLLAGIAHVNASGQQTADQHITELESRVEALEEQSVPILDIPVYEGAGDPNVVSVSYDVFDIVPLDPEVTLDLVCQITPARIQNAGVIDGANTLRCVRYDRIAPFYFGGGG